MRTVIVEKPIRDVDGVLSALKKAEPPFSIMSIGTDQRRTYVYLNDDETKDPSQIVNGWNDLPELRVNSTAPLGRLDIPEVLANGVDVHTVLIQKTTPAGDIVPGDERVLMTTKHRVKISNARPKLNEGMAMIQVGPSSVAGDARVEVMDPSGIMKGSSLLLRFISPKAVPPELPPPEPERRGGIMAALKKILGI